MCVSARTGVCILQGGGLCTVFEQKEGSSQQQGRVDSSGGSGSSGCSRDSRSEGITPGGPTSYLPGSGLKFFGALLF